MVRTTRFSVFEAAQSPTPVRRASSRCPLGHPMWWPGQRRLLLAAPKVLMRAGIGTRTVGIEDYAPYKVAG